MQFGAMGLSENSVAARAKMTHTAIFVKLERKVRGNWV
jgi:hypothetical protein